MNNQGSVRDVIDSAGKHRIHRRYDSFGNVVDETHYNVSGVEVTSGQTGYVDEAFSYTGRYFDSATGLQNNLNRWYNPSVGRWMSEDPIGFEAGDANLYRYVGNSPTNYSDPSGLEIRNRNKKVADFYIETRDGQVLRGKTGNDLLMACRIIHDGGKTIDTMIVKAHGLDGDPSTINDGPWMQSPDGHTLLGASEYKIFADDDKGYLHPLTDTLKDIVDSNTKIRLRGCQTARLAAVIAGATGAEVSGTPTDVINIPFTWWYIGPWGTF